MSLINLRLNKCRIEFFLENKGKLNSVPDCHKNQEMCNKAVDNHPYAL